MGNDQKGKAPKQAPKMPTAMEIKTYIMVIQNKLILYRNKKIASIKQKKLEIAKCLKENNLDVAKAKMDTIIREEDMITVYDILGPLCEILKERVTYIISNSECPPDLRAQLDSVIYASTRVEVDELHTLRDLIMRRYGQNYIMKADSNADKLVNVNLVEKLRIKPASDVFVTIRLKQLCKEQKIPFEFPCEVENDIAIDPMNAQNPYGGEMNPFDMSNNNNPYGPPPGNDNPYGPPPGNNNPNPYGPPPGNDNPYGPPPGNNNPNPYGPPPGNNNPNPYGPPPGNNNPNPYGPPPGNDNPYGPPKGNDNPYVPPSGNNNPNPYGPPPGNDNPYGPPKGNDNPYGPPQGNNNTNPYGPPQGNDNPYGPPQGNDNPYGPPKDDNNVSGFPQAGNPFDNNNQSGSQGGNPYGPPSGGNPFDNNNQSNISSNPYGPPQGGNQFDQPSSNIGFSGSSQNKDDHLDCKYTSLRNRPPKKSEKKEEPKPSEEKPKEEQNNPVSNPYTSGVKETDKSIQKENNDNPFGGELNSNDNPFGGDTNNNNNDNPFGGDTNNNNNDNPYASQTKENNANPFSNDDKISNSINMDNPFGENNNDNPYLGENKSHLDNPFGNEMTNSIVNPYGGDQKNDNPFEQKDENGEKKVSILNFKDNQNNDNDGDCDFPKSE